MLAKNTAITIQPAINGFIVSSAIGDGYRHVGQAYPISDNMVFNTMEQLTEFLDRHFGSDGAIVPASVGAPK